MKTVLVFGDSITFGEKGSEGGWVQKLKQDLHSREQDYFVYNLGIPGDTTRDVLERFEDELDRRREEDEESETILLFQVGINDSQFINNKQENRINIQEYQQNVENLILESRKVADQTIFLGLTPIIESKLDPVPWNRSISYLYKDLRRYEDTLYELTGRYNAEFIEIYDQFIDREYRNLLEDGLHPNTRGHKLIYRTVLNYLEEERLL